MKNRAEQRAAVEDSRSAPRIEKNAKIENGERSPRQRALHSREGKQHQIQQENEINCILSKKMNVTKRDIK
jgi:hypothetical protein